LKVLNDSQSSSSEALLKWAGLDARGGVGIPLFQLGNEAIKIDRPTDDAG
jgi:hypothetical protein